MELTILMPCLNEEKTIKHCVLKAKNFLINAGVSGEVLVADNGSSDKSVSIAQCAGARVTHVPKKGYGAALLGGIESARGQYIIMADADGSYDFEHLDALVNELRMGCDLVMGDRFSGGIESGAMPFLHKYLGNPVLSFLGRFLYRSNIRDFHCGLRGFKKTSILKLKLQMPGMEFASEMIVKATLHNLSIKQVPVKLAKDGRDRPPHLRTWRDGWRHLRFLLIFSPRWLFIFPGGLLFFCGILLMQLLYTSPLVVNKMGFDIHTMAYAGMAALVGFQMILFGIFTKIIGINAGWFPADSKFQKFRRIFTLERGLIFSLLMIFSGLIISLDALNIWIESGLSELDPREIMRLVIPASTLITGGGELFLSSFFIQALAFADKND